MVLDYYFCYFSDLKLLLGFNVLCISLYFHLPCLLFCPLIISENITPDKSGLLGWAYFEISFFTIMGLLEKFQGSSRYPFFSFFFLIVQFVRHWGQCLKLSVGKGMKYKNYEGSCDQSSRISPYLFIYFNDELTLHSNSAETLLYSTISHFSSLVYVL